ncbi:MAG: hypothetical protein JWN48_3258 [Myxococcaceae bacterium]|nr:hypothetical protein [Myxococcaceae bacterium]
MALSNRSKLICALGAFVLIAVACGDDGKGSSSMPAAGIAVGKACTSNSDCGTGGTCKNTQGFGTLSALLSLIGVMDLPAPGGYCSADCSSNADCGSGAVCLGSALNFLKGECRKSCTSNSDCREGYECAKQAEVPADAGLPTTIAALRLPDQCQAKPKADTLAAGQAGAACTTPTDGGVATECGDGFCAGGSCSGICNEDSTCGVGAVCIPNGFYGSAGTCQQACTADRDCKQFKANGTVGCIEANARKICGAKVFPLAPGVVGTACTADAQCGTTGQCQDTLGLRQTPAPGGYCSVLGCQDDSVCGGGTCAAGTCYAGCTSDASCRSGYTCQSVRVSAQVNAQVCAPAGTATTGDAGTPTTPVRDAAVPVATDAGVADAS